MVIEFVVKKHFKTFTSRIEQKNALFCLLALSLFNVTKFYAIHLLQLSIVSLTVNVSSDHLNIRELKDSKKVDAIVFRMVFKTR